MNDEEYEYESMYLNYQKSLFCSQASFYPLNGPIKIGLLNFLRKNCAKDGAQIIVPMGTAKTNVNLFNKLATQNCKT